MGGSAFVTRDPGGAVALVDAGRPGVRVMRENRVVATSDADGLALIPALDPNADNHLSVEARDYPIDVVLGDPDRTVVPRRHAGIVIDFAPVSFNPTLVTIETGTHATPPAGTPVQVAGIPSPMVMGRDGKLFIVDAKNAQTVAMNIAGRRCVARVEAASGDDSLNGQRVWCIREASDAD
jgi:outer membrane usher protein